MTKKKMNTYLKFVLILLGCTVIGGIIGFVSFMAEGTIGGLRLLAEGIGVSICRYLFAEFMVLLLIEVVFGERTMYKMKQHARFLETAEDDFADRIEYEMEKDAAWGVGVLNMIGALSMIFLATGYSIDYIKSVSNEKEGLGLLGACVVFIVIFTYNGLWGVRQVKLQQKLDPSKKGDPASTKFTEQWLESCDEAEREIIYQSAYKSYLSLSKWIPVLMIVTMIFHLVWNTGVMAVAVVGVVWMVQNVSYLKSCVMLRKRKLS